MKIVLTEYSSGFAHYSYVLCNELAKDSEIDELIYLSDENNQYFEQVNERVKTIKLFKAFSTSKQCKKGSIGWLVNRGWTTILNCFKRNRFIKKEKPDSVLIQATLSTFDCHFLRQIKKYAKIILTVHDVIVPTDSLSWNDKALKKMYLYADLLIVHSETNKQQLMKIFEIDEKKIAVVPHGVKSSYNHLDKQTCKQEIGINNNNPSVLFYGGIRKSKGLDVLIKALKGIECNLIIAGAPLFGETFDEYRNLIDENDIKTIEFIKFTEDSFRDILFQASDYIVLPYKEFYSQSGVFMQAIQYHIPVIATDVSSFKEYIKKYDIGYVAKPNDVEDLHSTLKLACSEKKEYKLQMEKAVTENSWEKVGERYATFLKDKMRC